MNLSQKCNEIRLGRGIFIMEKWPRILTLSVSCIYSIHPVNCHYSLWNRFGHQGFLICLAFVFDFTNYTVEVRLAN